MCILQRELDPRSLNPYRQKKEERLTVKYKALLPKTKYRSFNHNRLLKLQEKYSKAINFNISF